MKSINRGKGRKGVHEDAATLVTYVIEYPGTNLIKIGQAKYFVDRFAQLKTASPVDPIVICVFRGSRHERDFHKRFGHLRHHGEFYHNTQEVQDYLCSDAVANDRMTREEAEAISPRIERRVERIRRENKARQITLDELKAEEMEPSLETNE